MTATQGQDHPTPPVKNKRPRSPRRWGQGWPLGLGALVVVALVGITVLVENQVQSSQAVMRATLDALWLGNLAATHQAATQTQAATTATPAPPTPAAPKSSLVPALSATPTFTPTISRTPAISLTLSPVPAGTMTVAAP